MKTSAKFKIIMTTMVIVTILIITLIIYFLISQNNATAQIDEFSNAVRNEDEKALSKILSTNKTNISKKDTKSFIEYLKDRNHYNQFIKELDNVRQHIKDDDYQSSNLGNFKDQNNNVYLTVEKNGTQYLFLDRITFTPHLYNVYLKKSSNNSTYKYKDNLNNNHTVVAEKNRTSKLGSFFIGKHKLNAQKIYDQNDTVNGRVIGSFIIDTNQLVDNKVVARENFAEAWFKVEIDNTEQIDGDIDLVINEKHMKYKSGQTYGKYPASKPLQVYAEGKVNQKTFKTNTKYVVNNPSPDEQTIKLKFDGSDIEKETEKEKKIEESAKSFMNDYTKDLNKAYAEVDFNLVSKYFKPNTELANHIKYMVESKNKSRYSMPSFTSYKKDGNTIEIELIKEDKHKNKIKSHYTLEYDEKDDSFLLVSYNDI
ncbi:TcaA second domain-containing protein [Mammaliicoccus sciuri]|uniref:TcaA second domain-containing protein n=1 Tax=Mammaliicoccus sciuri TaxID=1296 RepID=UPI003F566B15